MDIWKIKHPWYETAEEFFDKYRRTYQGGQRFIDCYLKQFSKRETTQEFATRKEVTYCPSFAAAAINDIKNSIYQRMAEITRKDGDKTYQSAITGANGGVDLHGSTMNNFIGQEVLPELLVLGRVGVFVDMPPVTGPLIADLQGKQPYLYTFTAEQIPAWSTGMYCGQEVLTNVLLHETVPVVDEKTGLVSGQKEQARLLQLTPEGVLVTLYDRPRNDKEPAQVVGRKLLQGMKRIPFVIAEISHSLLKDAANYQIALLNMESSDIHYILKANFPFYVEQYDPRADNPYFKPAPGQDPSLEENVQDTASESKDKEVTVGTVTGRRVPVGTVMPTFINPSSEPLKASMEKEQQVKDDIRKLVNLAISNLQPQHASAESKGMDDRSLESGLSYIGLELERLERAIGEIWSAYMGSEKVPSVKYPRKYSLKTDKDRREDATALSELMPQVPSKTYMREIAKQIAWALLEQKVPDETLAKIYKEIDDAKYITSNAADIASDIEAGLVSAETASNARGYDGPNEVPTAKQEHADRLALIAKSQAEGGLNGGARGVGDQSANPKQDAKQEKKDTQNPDKFKAGEGGTK